MSTNTATEHGDISITACGRSWCLHRPADLESLWGAMTDADYTEDERLPYWVELWPSSLALAAWLHANQEGIKGKICLDLGCGLGFTALVASWLGAKVIGADYEKAALHYAQKNSWQNSVPSPLWLVMDWRKPALRPKSCDIILGGDIMYETRFIEPVLLFLEYALAEGGKAWLAEPGRNVYEFFDAKAKARGWKTRCVVREQVDPLHVQPTSVSVNLWELARR